MVADTKRPVPIASATPAGISGKDILIAILLMALTAAVFSPATGYEYLNYDDGLFVSENVAIQRGLCPSSISYCLTAYEAGPWAPLTWFSYLVDTTLMGRHPSSYHTTNIILHSLAGGLMYLALLAGTKSRGMSLVAAALFALHPLRTESVAWITERKDVLFGVWWMLGMLAYFWYAARPGKKRYAIVFLCFIGGMLSKFMLVTFPFVLLLLDFWPLNRLGSNWGELRSRLAGLVKEKVPFFLAAVVFTGITAWTQNKDNEFRPITPHIEEQLLRVLENYLFYLQKFICPWPRSILYPIYPVSAASALISLCLIAIITWSVIRQMWQRPWLLVGWLWFLGTLVPVIGFVSFANFNVTDRYSYLPSIGLSIMLVFGIGYWAVQRHCKNACLSAAGTLLVAACALATSQDLPRWRNSAALFGAAVKVGPHEAAYLNLSNGLLQTGDFAGAISAANETIRMKPSTGGYNNRGLAHAALGDLDSAIKDYDQSLKLNPNDSISLNNRGNAWTAKNNYSQALQDFTSAIRIRPDFAEAWNNRAFVRCSMGDYPGAIADCTRALEISPFNEQSYNGRGNVYAKMEDWPHAREDYDQAIRLNPGAAIFYNNRAAVYLHLKLYSQARADLAMCQSLGGQPSVELMNQLSDNRTPTNSPPANR